MDQQNNCILIEEPGNKLKECTKDDLKGLKFYGQRLDLEVYHLAYGTKKLRKCTYQRMRKRQMRKNIQKNNKIVVKTPQLIEEKGKKIQWLNKVEKMVKVLSEDNQSHAKVLNIGNKNQRRRRLNNIGRKKRRNNRIPPHGNLMRGTCLPTTGIPWMGNSPIIMPRPMGNPPGFMMPPPIGNPPGSMMTPPMEIPFSSMMSPMGNPRGSMMPPMGIPSSPPTMRNPPGLMMGPNGNYIPMMGYFMNPMTNNGPLPQIRPPMMGLPNPLNNTPIKEAEPSQAMEVE